MTGNGSINPFPTGIDKGTVQWVNWLHFGTPWDPKNRDWPEVIILPLQLLPARSTTLSFTLYQPVLTAADPSKLGTAQWGQKLYCILLHFLFLYSSNILRNPHKFKVILNIHLTSSHRKRLRRTLWTQSRLVWIICKMHNLQHISVLHPIASFA